MYAPRAGAVVSRFAPPCMFYSPGENFDSPQDNATFYAGKMGKVRETGKISPTQPDPPGKPLICAEKGVSECTDRGTKTCPYDIQKWGSLQ